MVAGKYEEHHTYDQPAETIEGQVERIAFPLGRSWVANEGDLNKVRELVESVMQALKKLDYRQYRLASRVESYDAMPKTNMRKVARSIAGEGATTHQIDALRKDIKRGLELRAAGGLNPPPITSGSSVDIPPALDNPPEK